MNKIYLISYVALLLLFTGRFSLYAQNSSFTATASKTSVSINEQFEITFTLTADGKRFTPPVLSDFHVLAGPNQSSSMEFVNGNVSQSISFGYIVVPKSEGVFKIGQASIEVGGKTLHTNVLTITVSKAASGAAKGNQGQEEQSIESQIADNLFIKAIVDKTNVVRGEGIQVTYKLFSKIDIVNFNLTKMPTLDGFWSQDEDGSKKLELKRETIDNVPFYTAEIKKIVLFPQREGTLTLDPMEAQTMVRIRTKRKSRGNDPFADFFNDPFFGGSYQDYNYLAKSPPIKVTVKPLPENAPEGFSGAVGSFSMESFIDKPETKANEPVSLKIKISGEGNIKLIDPVKLQLPPDIETYDPKISDNITVNQKGVHGNRTFEYLLIPRHAGEYKIKPFEFSYYSLQKKKYITLSSPEFPLKVLKGNDSEASPSNLSGVSKEDIQLLGKDIHYIKTGTATWYNADEHLFGSAQFYGMLVAPMAFLALFLVWRKKQEKDNFDVRAVKSRRATKIAKKRLALAHKYLKENKKDQVYEEVLRSLYGYVGDKFSISGSELSKDNIESILAGKGKDPSIIRQFLDIIDRCEFARYAPGGTAQADEVYQNSIKVIEQLEES